MTIASPLPPWVSGAHFDAPVLVTGLPRSGTSMVAGLLATCGLWLGRTVPGGPANIHGFFENIILREKLQKEILRHYAFDPLGVQAIPPIDWLPEIRNFRAMVAAALAVQHYDGERLWGFKDAKMTLTWRIWNQHFPRARWVIVRRPSKSVIASCLRTTFMKQHSSDPAFWRAFVDAYSLRLTELRKTVAWSYEVETDPIVARDFGALRALVSELGLVLQDDVARRFVTPEVWRAAP